MHVSWGWTVLLSAALLTSSCSKDDHKGGVDIVDGKRSGAAGSGDSPNEPFNPNLPAGGTTGSTTLISACVGDVQRGHEVGVDMYIMLDRSDSMNELTGTGPSKWEAMRQALTSFVRDPQSSDFGVGLQYFPLAAPGVPESCKLDKDCGNAGGQCRSRACAPALNGPTTFGFTGCFSDSDCPATSAGCQAFGVCSGDQGLVCFDVGPGGCDTAGDCVPYVGRCTKYTSCAINDYAAPAVSIDALSRNADKIVNTLDMTKPIGATPTPAALSGALKLATQRATDHPERRVIVVLATDGFPTECLPTSTQSLAQAVAATAKVAATGFGATPSILTYVIGVFSPTETGAKANLNQLAASGGTKTAFIVDQSQDVTQQLLEAFVNIRTGILPCEYQLPDAPVDQTLDFTRVNVELNTPSQVTTQTLSYVRTPSLCSKAKLGWYYDADPDQGEMPTKITVCPKTCDQVRAESGATIEIRLGCATIGPD